MSDIFISYAHEDYDEVKKLANRLIQEGWSVFWDRTIPIGYTWDEIIEKELNDARVVVVLWSKYSVDSKWVRIEASEADDRGILVPTYLEIVKIPIRFKMLQTADISDWQSGNPDTEGMQLLIEAITRIGKLIKKKGLSPTEASKFQLKFEKDTGKIKWNEFYQSNLKNKVYTPIAEIKNIPPSISIIFLENSSHEFNRIKFKDAEEVKKEINNLFPKTDIGVYYQSGKLPEHKIFYNKKYIDAAYKISNNVKHSYHSFRIQEDNSIDSIIIYLK